MHRGWRRPAAAGTASSRPGVPGMGAYTLCRTHQPRPPLAVRTPPTDLRRPGRGRAACDRDLGAGCRSAAAAADRDDATRALACRPGPAGSRPNNAVWGETNAGGGTGQADQAAGRDPDRSESPGTLARREVGASPGRDRPPREPVPRKRHDITGDGPDQPRRRGVCRQDGRLGPSAGWRARCQPGLDRAGGCGGGRPDGPGCTACRTTLGQRRLPEQPAPPVPANKPPSR